MIGTTSSTTITATTRTGLIIQFGLVCVSIIVLQIVVGRIVSSNEVKRRWGHFITGHLIVQFSYIPFPIHWIVVSFLIVACTIWYWFHYNWPIYMLILGPYLRNDELLVEGNTRKKQRKLAGAFWFVLATAIVLYFFPLPICRYSIQCLAVSDPIAAWIGQTIQSPKLYTLVNSIMNYLKQQAVLLSSTNNVNKKTTIISNKKKNNVLFNQSIITVTSTASVSGTVACFISSFIIGCILLPRLVDDNNNNNNNRYNWKQIFVGAIACATSEAYPIINDNLSIPIVTAIAVTTIS